jgi:Flp pilus assembly protein TadG
MPRTTPVDLRRITMVRQKRYGWRKRGVAATELALILPVLGFLCLLAIDYSRLFYTLATLSDCARAGAYYYATTSTATTTSIQQAALNDASNLTPTPTVVSTTGTDSGGNVYVQVTVSTTFTTIANFPGITTSTVLSRKVTMIRTY